MRVYRNQTVLDAALDRIRFLFDEFPEVVVSVSGGKDSTVLFYLCLQVAEEKGRLPLSVLWLDQEVEWQGTVDTIEDIMTSSRVRPYWFQMPMVITNNASLTNRYNNCWGENEEWVRDKHEISIKENRYNCVRFHDLFQAVSKVEWEGMKMCHVTGVRAEEAPKRQMTLTQVPKYKYITWGKSLVKKYGHYTFHPIYDWTYRDIWKFIHDNNLPYNPVYDGLYRHGVPPMKMRISNLHHETSVEALLLVQEIEPGTWEKVADRIGGANTIKHLRRGAFTCPTKLPYMFNDWKQYAIHLIENLVSDQKNKDALYSRIEKDSTIYIHDDIAKDYYRTIINTVLRSDWDFTLLTNFRTRPDVYVYRKWRKGLQVYINNSNGSYVPRDERPREAMDG